MTTLLQTWGRLENHGESGDGFIRLRLPEVQAAATYAAKSAAEGLEAVVVEVGTKAIPANAEYPEARGFSVLAEMLKPGRTGRTRLLLLLTSEQFRDVFHTLAEDVAHALAQADTETQAVQTFITRLSKWQSFLRRHGATGLSLEARRGLLGELVLLRDFILPTCGANEAVASWKGSSGASHDFQFRAACIEVKTTSASTPHSFHVSNVAQLDRPGQGQLFVFLLILEETESGDSSLPGVIDSIRSRLEGDSSEAFEACLTEAGYLEAQRNLYLSPRYTPRRHRFYRVGDGFPRLREDQLPEGVEGVKYQVAIAACGRFEEQDSTVVDVVFNREGDAGGDD